MNGIQHQEHQPEHTPAEAETGTTEVPLPPTTKKSNRNVFGIIGALLVSLCCIIGCVVLAGLALGGAIKAMGEEPYVESVVDQYMSAMSGKDAGKAYTLFSTRAKRNFSQGDLKKGLEGYNYVLFDGYQSVTITEITINAAIDSDPDMPQGVVAEVGGMISYSDGFTGDFTATLEKEGEEWRLFGINVNAPADKFSP